MRRNSKALLSVRAKARRKRSSSSSDEQPLLDRTKLTSNRFHLSDADKSFMIAHFQDEVARIQAELNTVYVR